jgi:hypothetical protein
MDLMDNEEPSTPFTSPVADVQNNNQMMLMRAKTQLASFCETIVKDAEQRTKRKQLARVLERRPMLHVDALNSEPAIKSAPVSQMIPTGAKCLFSEYQGVDNVKQRMDEVNAELAQKKEMKVVITSMETGQEAVIEIEHPRGSASEIVVGIACCQCKHVAEVKFYFE